MERLVRYIMLPALVSAVMIGSTGCELFKKNTEKKDASTAVLPTDREQIMKDKEAKTYTPEELKKGIVKGDWVIEKVGNREAVGEDVPFLKFVPGEKRVYGNNGCNVLNATYKYNPADSTVSFGNVITTMRACGKEGITDIEINTALNSTRYYSWELKDTQYYLYFYDRNHVLLMTLMHQNFQFLDGTWRVVAINENPVNVPDMKLVIDVEEGKLHGNTGCNILNGSLETDMETANSISFQKIATTRMACPDMKSETEFIVALEDAAYARPISKDKVLLLDNQGKVVLELVRSSDRQ